jgi:hypothetical protein
VAEDITIAVSGAACDPFAINIRIIRKGDSVIKNLNLRENGCREPIIENIKPHRGDNMENMRNRIKKS